MPQRSICAGERSPEAAIIPARRSRGIRTAARSSEIPETTKFIIAQRISSIQDADLILVLEGGQIDAMGTHEQLLASNRIYREVYDSQNKAGGADNG